MALVVNFTMLNIQFDFRILDLIPEFRTRYQVTIASWYSNFQSFSLETACVRIDPSWSFYNSAWNVLKCNDSLSRNNLKWFSISITVSNRRSVPSLSRIRLQVEFKMMIWDDFGWFLMKNPDEHRQEAIREPTQRTYQENLPREPTFSRWSKVMRVINFKSDPWSNLQQAR